MAKAEIMGLSLIELPYLATFAKWQKKEKKSLPA